MPDIEKLNKFVDLVLGRTLEGKLNWTETPDKEVFTAVLTDGGNMIKVFEYSVDPADGLPSLSLFTSSNKMVLDVQARDASIMMAEKLRRIYDLARSRATGEEEALNSALWALENL